MYRRPYRVTTDSNHTRPIAPNLLNRRFADCSVNRAWVGDITYIATAEGWLYLAVIMDLGDRRIVGWSMSDRINTDLLCQALKQQLAVVKGIAGEDDLVLRLLEERLNHGVGVARWHARNIRTGNNQIWN